MSHTTAPPKFLGNLTGVSFRPAEVKPIVYEQLKVGDTFRLEREPTNPHDGNAVRVLFDLRRVMTGEEYYGTSTDVNPVDEESRLTTLIEETIFCGFIERGVVASLARWMDEGFVYKATAKSRIENKMTPWLLEIEPTGEKIEPELAVSLPGLEFPAQSPAFDDDDIPF